MISAPRRSATWARVIDLVFVAGSFAVGLDLAWHIAVAVAVLIGPDSPMRPCGSSQVRLLEVPAGRHAMAGDGGGSRDPCMSE